MPVSEKERTVLRRLAEQQAEIGSLPVQQETARQWARLNGLRPGKPLVWINEICWHELEATDDEGEPARHSLGTSPPRR